MRKNVLTRFATARPGAVMLGVLALALVTGLQIARIRIDTDPENMLPAGQPDRIFHDAVERRFGLHDAIVVGVVNDRHPEGIYNPATLANIEALSDAALAMDGIVPPDLMSLATADNVTQGPRGALRFEWLMPEAPRTLAASLEIRAAVARLPLLQNTLVSGDGRAAAIYVPLASKDMSYAISRRIIDAAAALPGDDAFHVTGLPVAEDTFGHEMFVQMAVSAPLAGLVILLLMWAFFRSALLVLAPMLVAMATVVITMGLLTGLGFTVHIMSSMIPIFLMPIAVVDSVHIMSEFADAWTPGRSAGEVMGEVIDQLFTPMLFTSLTTAVGFASLLITPIPPVQVFGGFVAIGVLLAFVLTITLIPAFVVRLRPERLRGLARLKPGGEADSVLARALRAVGRFSFGRPRLITALAVAAAAVGVAGVLRIGINDNPVRWFKAEHRIRVADRVLNEHFAGTYDAFLVLEHKGPAVVLTGPAAPLLDRAAAAGADVARLREHVAEAEESGNYGRLTAAVDDALFAAPDAAYQPLSELLALVEGIESASRRFQDPALLAWMASLQDALTGSGLVGKASGLPDMVKLVARELAGGAPEDYAIPATARGVAQTLLQFQSSHRPQDLWHGVTPDYRSAAIWVQMPSGDNQHMTRVESLAGDWIADHPPPEPLEIRWAGKTHINVVWQDAMVRGMLESLLGAFLVVLLMMSVLFRSFSFGLLAMVPLSLTIVSVYGLIGWGGKDYDMPIAVLSALTLGLSVDFAIHFLQRARSIQARTGDFARTAGALFEEPARAISRNAIVIALGFTPLLFGPLVPYVTVGLFMAAIMAVSAVATLVLLPAILALMGRRLLGSAEDGGDARTATTGVQT